MDGMFADGTLYSAVSRNFANGNGTIWHMHFSKVMHDNFHEQPPLFFVLQSFFFRIFGDNIYPERFYDLVMAILNALLIMRIWKRIFISNSVLSKQGWIPVLLFFISPVTFWAFNNNVIEITMSLFVLASTDAIIAALIQNRKMKLNLVLASIWILAASLCKGFQGLFPLVLPVLFYFSGIKISFKKAIGASAFLLALLVFFYSLLFLSPNVRTFYCEWFAARMVNTFNGLNNTSSSHFFLLFELLLDLLPAIGIAIVILLISRIKNKNREAQSEIFSWVKLFFFYALCGSIPLLVTKEQRGFYLLTSLPYYSFVFALLVLPSISKWITKLENKQKTLKLIFVVNLLLSITILVFTFNLAGKPKRDADILHDIRLTGQFIGPNKTVSGDPQLFYNWGITNYYCRLYHISLAPGNRLLETQFYISDGTKGPDGYMKVPLDTKRFTLWEKN
jgi:4-amino-4-deoxy-L-arabinose transferase-like glycosyltransferase